MLDRRIDSTDRLAATLEMLARLVAFDTESAKSNLPLIADVEAYLKAQGVDYVKVPNAAGDKAALFATIGPKIDGGILLSGHTDVVPVTGQAWTSDPFTLRRDENRVYARGACDMKGFDALCLAMIPEFQRAGLKRPIHILLSYDEEIGCRGPLDTIARFGLDLPRPGIAIVGEPSLMQVADAHKSITTYRTTVYGHEAHSSKPYLGTSAIEVACGLIGELYGLADELKTQGDPSRRFDPPYSSIHVGIIRGGTARNILAKECAFEWEFRGLPAVAYDTALVHMNGQIARIAAAKAADPAKRARVETLAHEPVPSLNPEPGSAAESLALKLARRNATITVSYASEAGQFQTAGIPTVICGPGSIDQAHQPDEYIEVDQLAAGVDFMRRLAAELS
ncbi:acetylornithine deacetylase [uncultured Methylovirgula sp.]|uniref:acetylornithine deacetylase n=1 Tax=uncultured Methylovirgula sp. TaxID=1285960 RepID=UPI00262B3303|nr:acetylornithine deacetylase [uncultured Methylovirgula sp.]